MPKAKRKSKKATASTEPDHDPFWERAVVSGVWNRHVPSLPDAREWPTWGALRARILTSVHRIEVTMTATLCDAFPKELFRLSPARLTDLDIHGSVNLHQLVLSPIESCPNLKRINISGCGNLQFIMIQSRSLIELDYSHCPKLEKVLIQCRNLESMHSDGCENIHTIMIWSDRLKSINFMRNPKSSRIRTMELVCPSLVNLEHPPIKKSPIAVKIDHDPIYKLVSQERNQSMLCLD